MKLTCIECDKRFELTDGEIDFYRSKGLDLPKRCKSCRDNRSGRDKAEVVKKRPLLVFLGFLLVIISIASATAAFIMQRYVVQAVVAGSVLLIISFLLFAFSRKKVFVDCSFSRNYKYRFYDANSLYKHYLKHGKEVRARSVEDYLRKANNAAENKKAKVKITSDNDIACYVPTTGEFVVLSRSGYIRTYYIANDKYYSKQ